MAQAPRDENFVTATLLVGSTGETFPWEGDETTGRAYVDMAGGTGTVTSVSVVTANGFAGSVATATSTPAITLSTTVTGLLKGNGTAISAAVANTDYQSPIALTTTGTSGAATFNGTTLNIPNYTSAGTGDVVGPAAATDNAVARFDTTTGKLIQNSTVIIADTTGNISGTQQLTFNGTTSGTLAIKSAATAGTNTLTFPAGTTDFSATGGTGQFVKQASAGGALTVSTVPISEVAGLGTGVATALAVNTGSAGAVVLFNGALGTPSSGTVTNLTGTASININGTVGATTPTTGVFTTLVAGSTTSLLLGTAGSAVGNIGFRNATSGTITLAPVTGALGTVTLTLPAITDTLVTLTASQTLTNKTLTSPGIGGTALLAEGASIGLDPALSADGTWSGITMTGTAGYTQAFGDLVYLDPTDSRWEAADADVSTAADGDPRGILAMVVVAGTDGNACTLLLQGVIRADTAFPAMTVNAAMYVGETAGDIQATIPTGADNVIRVVGQAITADALYFNPSQDWQITVA